MRMTPDDAAVIARHYGSGRISAILPEQIATRGGASLQLLSADGKPIGEPVTAALRAHGDFARLRARIHPGLPPGNYAAELRADDGVRRLTVAIDPIVLLRVEPPMLSLAGQPGATVEATITLANAGNIAADLPDYGAVGIYEVNGVETAIARAYRSDSEEGLQTLSRFVEELRNGYGGLVKLRLEGVTSPLAAGKACSLRVAATLPERLRSGRVYTGVWPLANLNYAVRVEVAEPVRHNS